MNWWMETQNVYDFKNQVLNTPQTPKERLLSQREAPLLKVTQEITAGYQE